MENTLGQINNYKDNILFNTKFWRVITSIVIAFTITILVSLPGVEPLFVFFITSVSVFLGLNKFQKFFSNTIISYFLLQFIFVAILLNIRLFQPLGFNPKLHALFFGVACINAFFIIIKHFKYLWKNINAFKFLFIFFILNCIYFFTYHSDFRLSDISAGYPIAFAESFSNADAYFIAFLNSLCALASFTVSSMMFKLSKNINKTLNLFINVFMTILLFYYFIIIVTNFTYKEFGFGVFLSLFFILLLGFKIYSQMSPFKEQNLFINTKNGNILLNVLIFLSIPVTFFALNKSGLLAILFSLTLFISLLLYIKINPIKLIFNKYSNFLLIILSSITIVALIFVFNSALTEDLTNKISYFTKGFESLSTLKVRQVNWHFFINEWKSNLTFTKALFGFGLGASRESIFYISAMQPAYHLVQTTHNHLLDVFYEYGLMALIYLSAIFTIFINNIKTLFSNINTQSVKLISSINLSLLSFYVIYHLTDGTRIPSIIIFFSLIGFLTAYKEWIIRNHENI